MESLSSSPPVLSSVTPSWRGQILDAITNTMAMQIVFAMANAYFISGFEKSPTRSSCSSSGSVSSILWWTNSAIFLYAFGKISLELGGRKSRLYPRLVHRMQMLLNITTWLRQFGIRYENRPKSTKPARPNYYLWPCPPPLKKKTSEANEQTNKGRFPPQITTSLLYNRIGLWNIVKFLWKLGLREDILSGSGEHGLTSNSPPAPFLGTISFNIQN